MGSGYFGGRSKSIDMNKTSEFLADNVFDQSQLEFRKNEDGQNVVMMEENQWKMVSQILLNMYFDDGEGLIDLGTDNVFSFDDNGSLICENDGTWLSIDGNIIAYYYESSFEDGDNYVIKGYTPVIYKGKRAKMMIVFDSERPDGYIAGITFDYKDIPSDEQPNAIPKTLGGITAEDPEEPEDVSLSLKDGEEITFVADYYDYSGNFNGVYEIGTWKVDFGAEIANMLVDGGTPLAMYSFTDIYNQTYWTLPME